jgi:hypothetical protein
MRKVLTLAVALVACSKAEKPPTDTAAVAASPAMAPAPAALTSADLAGKWNGASRGEGSDSVTSRWTTESTDGVHGTLTLEGTKTPIPFTMTYGADSVVIASDAPFAMPDPKLPKMNFRSVGRMKDGKLAGSSTNSLGSKPDSVMTRGRFEATKLP